MRERELENNVCEIKEFLLHTREYCYLTDIETSKGQPTLTSFDASWRVDIRNGASLCSEVILSADWHLFHFLRFEFLQLEYLRL